MALDPLATVMDLRQRTSVGEDYLAALMLDAASAAIREAAGVPISRTTSTVKLTGPFGSKRLTLPGQPVTEVSSVLVDGEAVTDYKFVGGNLWRSCGWSVCEPVEVTVTMTHGLAEVPADIKQLVIDFAIAGILNADEGMKTGVAAEAIDDYRVQYVDGGAGFVFDIPPATEAMLRERFGGGVHVTSEAQ